MASGVITGFITAPFLVKHLGETTYGLWILIASMTSYFNLIDMGLRSSITRHVAFARARHDQESVNSILSTAQAILTAAGLITVIATFILVALIGRHDGIPPEQLSNVRTAMLLSGLTVAMILALSVFDAMLWAYERFDLLNGVGVIADVLQTSALLFIISKNPSIVSVAWVVFFGSLLREGTKMIICLRMDSQVQLAPRRITKLAAHKLFGYGLWKFLWSAGVRTTSWSGPIIIGARLGPEVVTRFNVASRLVEYAKGISTAGTGVVVPTATALHADERHAHQRILFIDGGKFCLALSLYFVTMIVLLGKPFITQWMGGALATASVLATVLAIGEILPMSQWITYSILLGRERHKVMALVSFVEAIIVVALGLTLAQPFGLMGVCAAFAIPGALFRGVFPIIYGCRVMEVPILHYVSRVLIRPILAIAIPAAGLAMLVNQRPPHGWSELICYGGAFSLAYGAACCIVVLGPEQLRAIVSRFKTSAEEVVSGESGATP